MHNEVANCKKRVESYFLCIDNAQYNCKICLYELYSEFCTTDSSVVDWLNETLQNEIKIEHVCQKVD